MVSSVENTFANVVIFAGQSNATDKGNAANIPASMQGKMTWARSFRKSADDGLDNGYWDYYQTGVNSMATQATAGTFGSACAMANRLFYTYGKMAFVINSAVGNTRLSNLAGLPNWSPSVNNSYYNRNINQHVIPALKLLPVKNYKIAAYVWSQGENDAMVQAQANEYQANLIAYIAKVRLDLGLPNLPFIISKLKSDVNPSTCPYASTIIAAQNYVIANIPNVYGIDNTNESFQADGIHYTDASYLSIGNKIADLINNFCQ